jgi:hypothetical protein
VRRAETLRATAPRGTMEGMESTSSLARDRVTNARGKEGVGWWFKGGEEVGNEVKLEWNAYSLMTV